MYGIPLSTVVVAACGGVFNSDPTPNPSLGRGFVPLRKKRQTNNIH